ncbi:hypothetical protein KIPB_003795, partial [Kipferlia bialata]
VITGGYDGCVKLCSIKACSETEGTEGAEGERERTEATVVVESDLQSGPLKVYSVAQDGGAFACGMEKGVIYVCPSDAPPCVLSPNVSSNVSALAMSYTKDMCYLVAGDWSHSLHAWKWKAGSASPEYTGALSGWTGSVLALSLSPDRSLVAVGSADFSVSVLRVQDVLSGVMRPLAIRRVHSMPVRCLEWIQTGDAGMPYALVSTGNDASVHVLNPINLETLASHDARARGARYQYCLSVHQPRPGMAFIVTGGEDYALTVLGWRMGSPKMRLIERIPCVSSVWSVHFVSHASLILAACEDGSVVTHRTSIDAEGEAAVRSALSTDTSFSRTMLSLFPNQECNASMFTDGRFLDPTKLPPTSCVDMISANVISVPRGSVLAFRGEDTLQGMCTHLYMRYGHELVGIGRVVTEVSPEKQLGPDGEQYDLMYPVETDNRGTAMLYMNVGEDLYQVSQRFLMQNPGIAPEFDSESYRTQIVEFLEKNASFKGCYQEHDPMQVCTDQSVRQAMAQSITGRATPGNTQTRSSPPAAPSTKSTPSRPSLDVNQGSPAYVPPTPKAVAPPPSPPYGTVPVTVTQRCVDKVNTALDACGLTLPVPLSTDMPVGLDQAWRAVGKACTEVPVSDRFCAVILLADMCTRTPVGPLSFRLHRAVSEVEQWLAESVVTGLGDSSALPLGVFSLRLLCNLLDRPDTQEMALATCVEVSTRVVMCAAAAQDSTLQEIVVRLGEILSRVGTATHMILVAKLMG